MASRNRNERGRFKAKNAQVANAGAVDVMNEADIPALSNMLQNGRTTFVLIWADWCGHCHRYKPTWEKLAKIPGRNANIASVHHDMQEKIPELADAKIQGYPSVVKVTPGGEIEEFPEEGNASASVAKTNAIPYMRDERVMAKELRNAPVAAPASPPAAKDSATPGTQIGITSDSALKNTEAMFDIQQSGGAHPLIAAFANAARQAAPAVALLASYVALQQRKHSRTFKAPKRASRRASTRRSRRTG
jgi:thiol-disulfide isomerase/thioredoxin